MKDSSTTLIDMSQNEMETVDSLIEFLYTDKVEATPTTAVELLGVANEYQLTRLKTLCEGIIEKGIDPETVIYVYKAAKLYEAKNLVSHLH
jgi:hypothetical protein